MSAAAVAIVDYGMGNLRSVEKALAHVGVSAEVTSDPAGIEAARGVVLPGVGAFPKAMAELHARGLAEAITAGVEEGRPTLGICLGLQLLYERSDELGGADGLGLLPGRVEAIGGPGLKLPQIGWSEVSWRRASRLCAGMPDPCAFYHVHSFAPVPERDADVLATALYGRPFATAVEREPVYGVQFHPEKSGPHGLRLLANFAAVCGIPVRLPAATAA